MCKSTHSNCEHMIVCLKCNELFILPSTYKSGKPPGTPVKYPGRSFINYFYNNESYFVDLLSEFEPTSIIYKSSTPSDEHKKKITTSNNKNRHVPYNIPTNIANNKDKKPISFNLIFIEDIEDKKPIPKRYYTYLFIFYIFMIYFICFS
jgi:hypothetical protein